MLNAMPNVVHTYDARKTATLQHEQIQKNLQEVDSLTFQLDIAICQNKSLRNKQEQHEKETQAYEHKLLLARMEIAELKKQLKRESARRGDVVAKLNSFRGQTLRRVIQCNCDLLDADQIIQAVCEETGITVDQMHSGSRKGLIPTCKFLCSYFIALYCSLPFKPASKKIWGKVDHSNIVYGRDTIIDRMEVDQEIKQHVANISQKLGITQ